MAYTKKDVASAVVTGFIDTVPILLPANVIALEAFEMGIRVAKMMPTIAGELLSACHEVKEASIPSELRYLVEALNASAIEAIDAIEELLDDATD